jgi:rhodanese-related sulfurtransferase
MTGTNTTRGTSPTAQEHGMKPSLSFGLRTMIIAALSVGLALAFNATRPDSLPLTPAQKTAAKNGTIQGEVSLEEAARLFASGQAVFVDARSVQEYAQGHIEGAVSIPVFAFVQLLPQVRPHLEGKTVVAYCDGEQCSLSQDLAEQLKANGLASVFVLKNGWSLWREAGLPMAASAEPLAQEGTPQEAVTQEILKQETAPEANLTQEAPPQPSSLAEPLPLEPRPQDAVPAEQTPAAPTPQEPKPAGDPS